jgi:hypothetical protein
MKPNTLPYQDGRGASSIARETSMRRDNDIVKVPKVTLYDIDYSIYYYLNSVWKPKVIDNDTSISVPVTFASGEKWAQIRANGFMRDYDRKILSPVIAIRRSDVSADERINMLPGQVWGGNTTLYPKTKLIPYKSSGMQYDKVAGQYLTKESFEFYLIDVPEYVRITYELIIWTDLQEQMNTLVQGLIPLSGHMWGDYWKFRTNIQSITHDNVNAPGEDRLIKTSMTLQVDGYLRNEYEYQQSKIQKAYSIKKVKFLEEGTEQILFDEIQDINTPTSVEPTANIEQTKLRRIL